VTTLVFGFLESLGIGGFLGEDFFLIGDFGIITPEPFASLAY
jgi:hypothetical protein